jgi:hypothetical protein
VIFPTFNRTEELSGTCISWFISCIRQGKQAEAYSKIEPVCKVQVWSNNLNAAREMELEHGTNCCDARDLLVLVMTQIYSTLMSTNLKPR